MIRRSPAFIGCIALLTWGLLTVAAGHAWAQPAPSSAAATAGRRVQAGVGILGAASVGEFATVVQDGAGGFLGHVDGRLGSSPFSLGGEIGWLLYGDASRTVSLASLTPEVPSASVDVNTSNAIFMLHARLRAQPQRGRWRPYVDGLVGFADIYTKSKVEGAESCDYVPSTGVVCTRASFGQQTQSRDFALSYGGGAGVMYRFRAREGAPRLDVSMRYLRGGTADYLTEGAVRVDGNALVLDFSRSRTDMITLYIGVAFGR